MAPAHNLPLLTTHGFALHRISGADADAFLQGQLTQAMPTVVGAMAVAGYCTPQGRLLATPRFLRRPDGDLEMLLPAVSAEWVVGRLRRFVMRSKVVFEPLDLASSAAQAIQRLAQPAEAAAWLEAEMRAGRPWLQATASANPPEERFTPQMVNLDLVDGVSFTKGCYPGQEIVARTHYLGKSTKRAAVFAWPKGFADGWRMPEDHGDWAWGVLAPSMGPRSVLAMVCLPDGCDPIAVATSAALWGAEVVALPYPVPTPSPAVRPKLG